LLVMGASLFHAECAERAGKAAGGRPQANGNGRRRRYLSFSIDELSGHANYGSMPHPTMSCKQKK
jgi:hypothetical protein